MKKNGLRISRTNRGLTLLEVVIAVFILSFAVSGILLMQSSSQRGTLDVYYEFLAVSLAKEPLEYYRGRGFRWLKKNFQKQHESNDQFVLGKVYSFFGDGSDYPCEAGLFQRKIEITPDDKDHPQVYEITVQVYPKDKNSFARLIGGKDEVTLLGAIFDGPGN
jgi:prepilin-type N-terminal cleavage/methylation domain-containing protein